MYPNLEADKYFLNLVHSGILSVSDTGIVYDLIKQEYLKFYTTSKYNRVYYNKIGIQVHRLVYLVYGGEIPYKITVNHKDGNKFNNNYSNLELTTYAENNLHACRTGLSPYTEYHRQVSKDMLTGEKNINAIFKDEDVPTIRDSFSKAEMTIKEITIKYNVTQRAVKNMLYGITFSHLPNVIENKKEYFKASPDLIDEWKELIKEGKSFRSIGKLYNIHYSTVSYHLNKTPKNL